MLNRINRSKMLQWRIITPVLASVVTVVCILATNEPIINSVKIQFSEHDTGLDDPKAAIECWEKHGNFHYTGDWVCEIVEV